MAFKSTRNFTLMILCLVVIELLSHVDCYYGMSRAPELEGAKDSCYYMRKKKYMSPGEELFLSPTSCAKLTCVKLADGLYFKQESCGKLAKECKGKMRKKLRYPRCCPVNQCS